MSMQRIINKLLRLLLANGANVNAKDNNGVTALMCAARKGHTESVRLLLEARAYVNAMDKNGQTALMYAAVNGYADIAELLLANGAG